MIKDVTWLEWIAFAYAIIALAALVAVGFWLFGSYHAPLVSA